MGFVKHGTGKILPDQQTDQEEILDDEETEDDTEESA